MANKLKTIPDAQMSGYYADTSSSHKASEGRLGSGTGWIGSGTSSWLQVSSCHAVYTLHYHTYAYTAIIVQMIRNWRNQNPDITNTRPCNIQRFFTAVKMTIFS